MDDINFQDDGDKDITYVPGESEEEPRSVKPKGRFLCGKCSKSFKLKTSMHQHMRLGHAEKILKMKCHLCKKVFKGKRNLKIHIKSVYERIRYICTYCSGKFSTTRAVRRLEKTFTKMENHQRKVVKFVAFSYSTLKVYFFTWEDCTRNLRPIFDRRQLVCAIIFQCQRFPLSFPGNASFRSLKKLNSYAF